jgi:hypothetical protein
MWPSAHLSWQKASLQGCSTRSGEKRRGVATSFECADSRTRQQSGELGLSQTPSAPTTGRGEVPASTRSGRQDRCEAAGGHAVSDVVGVLGLVVEVSRAGCGDL